MNLNQKTDQLIETIDTIVSSLIIGKEVEPVKLFPAMMQQIGEVFPVIVEQDENSAVWMELLGRISTALETKDRFQMVDILLFEVRESLVSFRERRLAGE